jgi:uridine kinase
MAGVRSRVVLLAGPSGSGKSHLADGLGLPVVRLDDFYRDGDDPALPRSPLGIVDWDDPRSWDADVAVDALVQLCTTGIADIPVYDIAADGRVGHRTVSAAGSSLIVAEGIFADQIVAELRRHDVLALAVCIRHHRLVTFVRRLYRDLREQRKPPWVLVRRGWALLRDEPHVVRRCVEAGCEPLTARAARSRIAAVIAATRA